MIAASMKRTGLLLVVTCVIALGAHACGGDGGNGGGGGGSGTPTQPGQANTPTSPADPTATATSQPRTGTPTTPGPEGSPTPTPEPAGPFIVRPGRSISSVARNAPPGSTIIVSPGSYAPVVLRAGDLAGAITLLADETGLLTESPVAPVVINARGRRAAIELVDQFDVTIDGFTLRGGNEAGLLVVGSSGILVLNCTLTRNAGDGVRLEDADTSLLFNNLIFNNAGAGVRLLGTFVVEVVNNTVYGSGDTGIFVGGDFPALDTLVKNNIIDNNVPLGIVVDPPSLVDYVGDFNLNTDGYGAETPVGADDISSPAADPQFIFPSAGDFHLSQTSPALDAGDPATEPGEVFVLTQRTTQTNGSPDVEPVDLGFHYLAPEAFATPTPEPTAVQPVF